jgi:hypothetical protein
VDDFEYGSCRACRDFKGGLVGFYIADNGLFADCIAFCYFPVYDDAGLYGVPLTGHD